MGAKVTKSQTSPAMLALQKFAQEHSTATALLLVATGDYAAARCLLQHGLFTGLTLGAQAMEKFLKAYLLFKDPKRAVINMKHKLPKLLREVEELYPNLSLSVYLGLVKRFEQHYHTRYPGDPKASTLMTTADIRELDLFIVFLNENMPCPLNVKMRTGFYAMITFSLGYASTITPTEFWIKNDNQALMPLLPGIANDYAKTMKDLYP